MCAESYKSIDFLWYPGLFWYDFTVTVKHDITERAILQATNDNPKRPPKKEYNLKHLDQLFERRRRERKRNRNILEEFADICLKLP